MPNRDRTGPAGLGPRSGRVRGRCGRTGDASGSAGGFGRGAGRGFGFGRMANQSGSVDSKEALERQARLLERQLDRVNQQIAESTTNIKDPA